MSDPMPPAPPPPPAAPPSYPPPAAGGGGTVSPNRTIMLVLAYLGILALIPFLVEKDDREVQWHAKHGLVLFGAEIALWIVLSIFTRITAMVLGPVACLGAMLMMILGLVIFAFHIFLIVKAVNGERVKIPTLSDFADKF